MDGFAVLHPGLELQTRQLRDVFLDFTVIKLRAFDPVLIQNSAINRRPFIIRTLNPVGNHHVIVQVRIACAGVVMTEFRTNNPAFGVDLPYPVMAPPGHNHGVFKVPHHVLNCVLMSSFNVFPQLLIAQSPRNRNGFRRRKHKIETRYGGLMFLTVFGNKLPQLRVRGFDPALHTVLFCTDAETDFLHLPLRRFCPVMHPTVTRDLLRNALGEVINSGIFGVQLGRFLLPVELILGLFPGIVRGF